MSDERVTRRELIKKAAYIAPLIVTMKASFSFASAGSGDYTDSGNPIEYIDKDKHDKKDKKDYKNNFIDLTNKTNLK